MKSVGERLRSFRYGGNTRNVPWRMIRSINVAEFRLDAPDLQMMKNLVSMMAECALTTAFVREGTDADIVQLLHLFQVCLQFTLWSQQVLKEQLVEKQQEGAVAQVTSRYVESLDVKNARLREELAAVTQERDTLHMTSTALNKSLAQMETAGKMLERQLREEKERTSELIDALNKQATNYCAQALSRPPDGSASLPLPPPPPRDLYRDESGDILWDRSSNGRKRCPLCRSTRKRKQSRNTVFCSDSDESDATSYGPPFRCRHTSADASDSRQYVDWKTLAQLLLSTGGGGGGFHASHMLAPASTAGAPATVPMGAAPVVSSPPQQQQQQKQKQQELVVSEQPSVPELPRRQVTPIREESSAVPPPASEGVSKEEVAKIATSVDMLADDLQEQMDDIMRRSKVSSEEFMQRLTTLERDLRTEQKSSKADLLNALSVMEADIVAKIESTVDSKLENARQGEQSPPARTATVSRKASPKVTRAAIKSAPATASLKETPITARKPGGKAPTVKIVEAASPLTLATPHSPFGDSYTSYVSNNNTYSNIKGNNNNNNNNSNNNNNNSVGNTSSKAERPQPSAPFSINVLRTPPQEDLNASGGKDKKLSYWEDSSILTKREASASPLLKKKDNKARSALSTPRTQVPSLSRGSFHDTAAEELPASAAVRAAQSLPANIGNPYYDLEERPAGVAARSALLGSPSSSHLDADDYAGDPLLKPPSLRTADESLIMEKEVPCNKCGHPVPLTALAEHEARCNGTPPPQPAHRGNNSAQSNRAPSPIPPASFLSHKSAHASSLMLQETQQELRQLLEEEEARKNAQSRPIVSGSDSDQYRGL